MIHRKKRFTTGKRRNALRTNKPTQRNVPGLKSTSANSQLSLSGSISPNRHIPKAHGSSVHLEGTVAIIPNSGGHIRRHKLASMDANYSLGADVIRHLEHPTRPHQP
jgi:hypothetical protein